MVTYLLVPLASDSPSSGFTLSFPLDGLQKIINGTKIQVVIDRVRTSMSSRRFLHTLGVMHTLNTLANIHGLCPIKATLVSLLHDLSKEIEPSRIRSDLRQRNLDIPKDDLDYPKVWHGYHASVVARQEMGITDPDILEAVALHTTADATVCPMTRAIYVADFCEPGRTVDSANDILGQAKRNLDQGFREALLKKTGYMTNLKKLTLSPRTHRAVETWLPCNLDPTAKDPIPEG